MSVRTLFRRWWGVEMPSDLSQSIDHLDEDAAAREAFEARRDALRRRLLLLEMDILRGSHDPPPPDR